MRSAFPLPLSFAHGVEEVDRFVFLMELCSPHGAKVVDDLKRLEELKYVGAAPGAHEVDRSSRQSPRGDFAAPLEFAPNAASKDGCGLAAGFFSFVTGLGTATQPTI